jgi:hypothetical protein
MAHVPQTTSESFVAAALRFGDIHIWWSLPDWKHVSCLGGKQKIIGLVFGLEIQPHIILSCIFSIVEYIQFWDVNLILMCRCFYLKIQILNSH